MCSPYAGGRARTIFCLAGVPAVGKSTVRAELARQNPRDVKFLRRWTTRPLRAGEEEEVVHLSRGDFVERTRRRLLTAVFCSNHAMYGISTEELEGLLRSEARWIGCLSASASLSLRALGYEVCTVYLTVRKREVLLQRLCARGHTAAEIAVRMHEFDDADAEWRDLASDHVVYTDELLVAETVRHVRQLLGLPRNTPCICEA